MRDIGYYLGNIYDKDFNKLILENYNFENFMIAVFPGDEFFDYIVFKIIHKFNYADKTFLYCINMENSINIMLVQEDMQEEEYYANLGNRGNKAKAFELAQNYTFIINEKYSLFPINYDDITTVMDVYNKLFGSSVSLIFKEVFYDLNEPIFFRNSKAKYYLDKFHRITYHLTDDFFIQNGVLYGKFINAVFKFTKYFEVGTDSKFRALTESGYYHFKDLYMYLYKDEPRLEKTSLKTWDSAIIQEIRVKTLTYRNKEYTVLRQFIFFFKQYVLCRNEKTKCLLILNLSENTYIHLGLQEYKRLKKLFVINKEIHQDIDINTEFEEVDSIYLTVNFHDKPTEMSIYDNFYYKNDYYLIKYNDDTPALLAVLNNNINMYEIVSHDDYSKYMRSYHFIWNDCEIDAVAQFHFSVEDPTKDIIEVYSYKNGDKYYFLLKPMGNPQVYYQTDMPKEVRDVVFQYKNNYINFAVVLNDYLGNETNEALLHFWSYNSIKLKIVDKFYYNDVLVYFLDEKGYKYIVYQHGDILKPAFGKDYDLILSKYKTKMDTNGNIYYFRKNGENPQIEELQFDTNTRIFYNVIEVINSEDKVYYEAIIIDDWDNIMTKIFVLDRSDQFQVLRKVTNYSEYLSLKKERSSAECYRVTEENGDYQISVLLDGQKVFNNTIICHDTINNLNILFFKNQYNNYVPLQYSKNFENIRKITRYHIPLLHKLKNTDKDIFMKISINNDDINENLNPEGYISFFKIENRKNHQQDFDVNGINDSYTILEEFISAGIHFISLMDKNKNVFPFELTDENRAMDIRNENLKKYSDGLLKYLSDN